MKAVHEGIEARSNACRSHGYNEDDSPFIFPIFVDENQVTVDKNTFALAVREEGIGLNPDYRYLVADWPWVQPYLSDSFGCPNARSVRDRTFNLYLNENYGPKEAEDTIEAILKVEAAFQASSGS